MTDKHNDTTETVALDEGERTRCEVWTRVMGYHRPLSAFNAAKVSEHEERRYFCNAKAEEKFEVGRVKCEVEVA
jgi:hypothetical protein